MLKHLMLKRFSIIIALMMALFVGSYLTAEEQTTDSQTKSATKLFRDGNYKEALEKFKNILLANDVDLSKIEQHLTLIRQCWNNLGTIDESDAYLEKLVQTHSDKWKVLSAVANSYNSLPHDGFMIAGEFNRGNRRYAQGAKYVNVFDRDRVRRLQLFKKAHELALESDIKRYEHASLLTSFSNAIYGNRSVGSAWRLQRLTDLSALPDYEDSNRYSSGQGTPVDEQGNPIFYNVPESFEASINDGERWRWLLNQVVVKDPVRKNAIEYEFARFLNQQFGVHTVAGKITPYQSKNNASDKDKPEPGPFAFKTLKDTETICELATGVKRITLPDEFNPIIILQKIANPKTKHFGDAACQMLTEIYKDRMQFPKAVEMIKKSISDYGSTDQKKKRLNAIVGNWGQFETANTNSSEKGAEVSFKFRNAKSVKFTAHKLKIELLLQDIKKHISSNPKQLDWNDIQVGNLGYNIVQRNKKKYVGEEAANWNLELEPADDHFDRRITIKTPLKKAGAYIVESSIDNGNQSRIILWVADTVLVQKNLDKKSLYIAVDANTGDPLEKMNIEFFGYKQEWIQNKPQIAPIDRAPGAAPVPVPIQNRSKFTTKNFAEFSNDEGQVIPDPKLMEQGYQWMVMARNKEGRLAFLGFNNIWYRNSNNYRYNQVKSYFMSDRPIYRPGQSVKFKFWVRRTNFEDDDLSPYANQSFNVEVKNQKNESVYKKTLKADAYGGFDDEVKLAEDAQLGSYSVQIRHANRFSGNGSFRVEEYKKPEYEVTVESPEKPVALGEVVKAKIRAKYYFGTPVTKAKVKYKVTRTNHDNRWYPADRWDWLYGNGYWWFANDYSFYPGFYKWGCFRPTPPWWGGRSAPPELVTERTVDIGPDGTVEVEIDTSIAKALHGDKNHKYSITAEVVDDSRRTIVGSGSVLVAKNPFKVFTWLNRGHYWVNEVVQANFKAQTLDKKGIEGEGKLTLFKISYDDNGKPSEEEVESWKLNTNADGEAQHEFKPKKSGQYRLSFTVKDSEGRSEEGAYLFIVRGDDLEDNSLAFDDLEIIPDKKTYQPGDVMSLAINTNRVGSTILLFVRPENGTYEKPVTLKLKGKTTEFHVPIEKGDMPNIFIEAITVSNARVFTATKNVAVPPEKRVLDVEVVPSKTAYLPGEKGTIQVKLKDPDGKPATGSVVLSIYDRSVDAIAGGSNVREIKEFFWKYRRNHNPLTMHSLNQATRPIFKRGETQMAVLGRFGHLAADVDDDVNDENDNLFVRKSKTRFMASRSTPQPMATMAMPMMRSRAGNESAMPSYAAPMKMMAAKDGAAGGGSNSPAPTSIRKNFADTALWVASLDISDEGIVDVPFTMPENLGGWKIQTWAMGNGTRVGENSANVVTRKNIFVRLQAPRFFVEKDEVVLSAIVHNELDEEKSVTVQLELGDETLNSLTDLSKVVTVKPHEQVRVDWRVKVIAEGNAIVTMKALSDVESDAMQQTFPVYVHGMLKTESFTGVIDGLTVEGEFEFTIPEERRENQTRFELRYSPSLAGAMVDALPYLVEFPYGCTEQTLNRFLPTVITQKILQEMNLDLKAIQEKRTNLNAQEIGDSKERAKRWKHWKRNPVFDNKEVDRMVKHGLVRLSEMQLSDGGWGWFSGYREHSSAHTTATVVHGLLAAYKNGVAFVDGPAGNQPPIPVGPPTAEPPTAIEPLPPIIDKGIKWLENYRKKQLELLLRGDRIRTLRAQLDGAEKEQKKVLQELIDEIARKRYKLKADNLDAFVEMVLSEEGKSIPPMREYLYRDRTSLSMYSLAMFGLVLERSRMDDELVMVLRNIQQFFVEDEENQTAYLKLPAGYSWWYWHGNEIEANAYYLKLLTKVNPQGRQASWLVKYLLNNRKNATYWNSTRDTALCIEAFADYFRASGENDPDMNLEILVDGESKKTLKITKENLFTFDGTLVLEGKELASGKHKITMRKTGRGSLYWNGYTTNFTLEDYITKAGLEIKVKRKFYKLVRVEAKTDVAGSRGQVVSQNVEKYKRIELTNVEPASPKPGEAVRKISPLAMLKSGDLIEVELEIDSKNDYEYLIFEDMKASGFEPVNLLSGYIPSANGAYVEFRDERAAFFLRSLPRGKSSMSYRLRAEIPGKFSALPTKAHAMYAPELKANSDEMKVVIED